jgi:hypothetical protein
MLEPGRKGKDLKGYLLSAPEAKVVGESSSSLESASVGSFSNRDLQTAGGWLSKIRRAKW